MKCLVVDDSAITRRILANCLRAIGFDAILEATDGSHALEVCDATVDLVITDWNMPGLAGVEMVRSLRANPKFSSLLILLVTSRNGKDDVVEAARAGVDGYIVKPVKPELLRAKIDELLHRDEATGSEG